MQVTNPGIKTYLSNLSPVQQSGKADSFATAQNEQGKKETQQTRDTTSEQAALQTQQREEKTYTAPSQKEGNFYASYEATTTYIENYNQFSASLRRNEALNTYADNGGEFNRVGDRASILPINQVGSGEQESVRAVGIANEGAFVSESQYTLRETTRAIETYNQVAQSAKNAQNHMTYLQISMSGLSSLNYLGSA